jgi:predicted membrane-bound dolichyl-phosphate-mannose-protein mannosyltransferase
MTLHFKYLLIASSKIGKCYAEAITQQSFNVYTFSHLALLDVHETFFSIIFFHKKTRLSRQTYLHVSELIWQDCQENCFGEEVN